MLTIIFFSIGIVLLVLQTTLFQVLPSWLGKPDLYFLLIIFLAWRMEIIRGSILVIVLAVIMDVFSGVYLGIYPVTYLLIFLLIKGIEKYLPISNSTYQIPLTASAYFIVTMGNYIASYLYSQEPPAWFWPRLVWQVALLCLLTLPVLAGYDFVFRKISTINIKKFFTFKSRSNNQFH